MTEQIPYKPEFTDVLIPNSREMIEMNSKWTRFNRFRRGIYCSRVCSKWFWGSLFVEDCPLYDTVNNKLIKRYSVKTGIKKLYVAYTMFEYGYRTLPDVIKQIRDNKENLLCQEDQLNRLTSNPELGDNIFNQLPCILKFPEPELNLPLELVNKLEK